MSRYRRCEGNVLPRGERNVVVTQDSDGEIDGAHFRCPCDQRLVFCRQPPHGVTFDAEGLLTLVGSVGSRGDVEHGILKGRPRNWCHFFVKRGEVEMCGDARCPGGAPP